MTQIVRIAIRPGQGGTIGDMDEEMLWDESNRDLVATIKSHIDEEGRITFARFMEDALYHPEHGYYLAAASRPGREGDFLTAPEAHPIFGHALARQIDQMWQILGHPEPFTLREYGAGAGTLALAILEGLRSDQSGLLAAIRYEPVEVNPHRRIDLVAGFEKAGFVNHLIELSDDNPLVGCILANEFLDAFPVHRVEVRDGQLMEVYVTWRDGWFAEELGPPSIPDLVHYFETAGVELVEGQRAEVNLTAAGWIARLASQVARGYVLVIDYGYPAIELYGPDRRAGTFKAYVEHAVHEDPYRAIGHQDLTAHVDFTALERAALNYGFRPLGLTTQAEFLSGAGIGELLVAMQQQEGMTLERYVAARAAVMRMIDPGAMGRFRVLVLGRDVPDDPPLRGLTASL